MLQLYYCLLLLSDTFSLSGIVVRNRLLPLPVGLLLLAVHTRLLISHHSLLLGLLSIVHLLLLRIARLLSVHWLLLHLAVLLLLAVLLRLLAILRLLLLLLLLGRWGVEERVGSLGLLL